ncbi:MAG: hypothetical protein Q6353_021650 [Candidatus Sigynarchaeum springense]
MSDDDPAWDEFLRELARKTKSKGKRDGTRRLDLPTALNNAIVRPEIFLLHGIHGNILFPDVGYCEFDNPASAWQHIHAWSDMAMRAKGDPASWRGCFPVGFEIGIASLEELSKKEPVWPLFKECGIEIINPLYSQPYLRHCGEESTIRQFEVGLGIMARNGLVAKVFASSEHALHPQLPQLLKGFKIGLAFATARLAGGAPTSYQPKVEWEGLDGTTIPAIVAQSGLSSGHVWHGRFFEEIPGLIFSAVSRPDLPAVVYANIEDFANPMPGSEAIANHVAELERARIRLRGFSSMADILPLSRRARWSIEDFPIRSMESKLVHLVRRCEDFMVLAEAADVLLSAFGSPTHETQLDEAWRHLLMAQNHDAYIVPFIVPGLYSEVQGLPDGNPWTSEETIEERSIREVEVATSIARSVLDATTGIDDETRKIAIRGSKAGIAMLNMLWDREEIIGGLKYTLPSAGYASIGTPFKSNASLTFEGQTAIIYGRKIEIGDRAFPVTRSSEGIVMDAGRYKAVLKDAGSRIEIHLVNQSPLEISVEAQSKVVITYPFGAEPSTEREGHSSRFAWIDDTLVIAHNGTPYFKQSPGKYKIRVPAGEHAYCIAKATCLLDAYKRAWEFAYPPVPFSLPAGSPPEGKFARIAFEGCVPVSFRARGGLCNARFLSIDGSEPIIEGGAAVDFYGQLSKHDPVPWRIMNFELPISLK